jgi:hypothetical protein
MSTTYAQSDEMTIDLLIPRPRPWWVRLIIGIVVVAVAGTGAYLWGYGYITPQPDCCGGGSGGAMMGLTPDGQAVTVTAFFYNSSQHDIVINAGSASLPQATVIGIGLMADFNQFNIPVTEIAAFPAVVRANSPARLLITFVPDSCVDTNLDDWGTVTTELDIADSALPSIGRSYRLPGSVVQPGNLSVFWPDGTLEGRPTTPLAAACELLGIDI